MTSSATMRLYGLVAIFVSSILFGVAGAVAKMLFAAELSPLDLTAVRSFVACAVLGLVLLLLPGRPFYIPRTAWRMVLAAGLVFIVVNVTFYLSISLMSVAAAITLEYTSPFFVMVLGALMGQRRISGRDLGIVALSVVGCFLLTGGDGAWVRLSLGLVVGVSSGFAFAVFTMIGNRCKQRGIGAIALTFWTLAISSVVWLAALPFLSVHQITLTWSLAGGIGFIAVAATILPYGLLLFGLRHVDALPATVIGLLDPLVAGLAAYLLLGETLATPNLLGIGLICIAVILVTRAEARTRPAGT